MKVTLRLNPSKKLGIEGKEGDEIDVTEEQAKRLLKLHVIHTPQAAAELKAVKKDAEVTSRDSKTTVTVQRQQLTVDDKKGGK